MTAAVATRDLAICQNARMNPWGYVAAAVIGALVVLYTNRTKRHDTLKTLVEIHKDMPPGNERRALAAVIRAEVDRLTQPTPPSWWSPERWHRRDVATSSEDRQVTSADEVVSAIERSVLSNELRSERQRLLILPVATSAVAVLLTILAPLLPGLVEGVASLIGWLVETSSESVRWLFDR